MSFAFRSCITCRWTALGWCPDGSAFGWGLRCVAGSIWKRRRPYRSSVTQSLTPACASRSSCSRAPSGRSCNRWTSNILRENSARLWTAAVPPLPSLISRFRCPSAPGRPSPLPAVPSASECAFELAALASSTRHPPDQRSWSSARRISFFFHWKSFRSAQSTDGRSLKKPSTSSCWASLNRRH